MPIKFRCRECRQFLGISRSQAGQVVDCPTCGRTVRVPRLDGTVDPLPPPELDLKDSGLASALNELAMIGQVDPDDEDAATSPDESSASPPQKTASDAPQPLPDPVVIDPPAPVEPVPVSTPVAAPSESPPESRTFSARLEQQESSGFGIAAPSVPLDSPFDRPRYRPRRRTVIIRVGILLLIVGFIFISGVLVGRYALPSRSGPDTTATAAANPGEQDIANLPAEGQSNAAENSIPAAVTGRITYRSADGDIRPDTGARVIILPAERTGTSRLPLDGFRPGTAADPDGSQDLQVARAALQALGGDVAVVDDQGRFELSLKDSGSYEVLAISNFQQQTGTPTDEAAVTSLLARYFDSPQRLLGQRAWHHSPLRYRGTAPVIWDHAFE